MHLPMKLLAGVLAAGLSACALGAAERVPSLSDPSNPEAPESPVHHMAVALAPSGGAPEGPGVPAASTDAGTPSTTVYTCPMHPEVTSPEPGRCPKCGMKLVPRGGKP
jgi:hypothetical protein